MHSEVLHSVDLFDLHLHTDRHDLNDLLLMPEIVAGYPTGYVPTEVDILQLQEPWNTSRLLAGCDRKLLGLKSIRHRLTGELIGACGIGATEVDSRELHELSFFLVRKYRGRGIVTKFCAWLLQTTCANDTVVAFTKPEHAPANRVLSRLGFNRKGKATIADVEVEIWVRKIS